MASLKKISLEESKTSEPTTISLEADSKTTPTRQLPFRVIFISLAVIVGLTSGYFIAKYRLQLPSTSTPTSNVLTQNPTDTQNLKVGDIFGSSDESSFKDSATGIIKAGGIDGEGSHHLERGADKSQWVYLTSSIIDLDLFLDTKVELWGETFQAKKAGWLMDVGRIKVLGL